jgi:hypothetical protein
VDTQYVLLTGTLADGFTFVGPFAEAETAAVEGCGQKDEWVVVELTPPTTERAWHINVYERFRHYGGPEEGGWWYDSGVYLPMKSIVLDAIEYTAEQANRFALNLQDQLNAASDEHEVPPVHSVGYHGGRYTVQTSEEVGADWPAERPHYQ